MSFRYEQDTCQVVTLAMTIKHFPYGRSAEQILDELGVPKCEKGVHGRCWVKNSGGPIMERMGEECLTCERWSKISSGEIQGWSRKGD